MPSALDVAKRLAAAPAKVDTQMQRAVAIGGEILAAGARAKLPSFLRNVGASGAAIGTKSTVRGHHRPAALVRVTGPAWLYDNDRRAHTITATPGHPLATPNGPRMAVRIPAITGKHSFDRGITDALPAAKAVLESAFRATASLI